MALTSAISFLYLNSPREGGADATPSEWGEIRPVYRWALIGIHFGRMLYDGYSQLGWFDTTMPMLFFVLWIVVSAVAVTSLYRREPLASLAPGWAWAFVVVSAVAVAVQSYLAAFGWQGRYILPPLFAFVTLLVPVMGRERGHGEDTRAKSVLALIGVQLLLATGGIIYTSFRFVFGYASLYERFDNMPVPSPGGGWLPAIGLAPTLVTGAVGMLLVAAIAVDRVLRDGFVVDRFEAATGTSDSALELDALDPLESVFEEDPVSPLQISDDQDR